MRHILLNMALALGCAGTAQAQGARDVNETTIPGHGTEITAEIWADNWFSMYVNGKMILEDSTPYRTERSFNAERVTFRAELPMTVAFEFRDFMENNTGLEYIGTDRQQMGDGGAIAQFWMEGDLLGVTDDSWLCFVANHAPVDPDCARLDDPREGQGLCAARNATPAGDWTAVDFDDRAWMPAVEHSERSVRPKDGYDQIDWVRRSRLIWSGDLERDNVVLCRGLIGG